MDHKQTRRVMPGDLVEVRPWQGILSGLDNSGMLEGLPFMPEMLKFAGHRFTVSKRLERTCEETAGEMKRIKDVVFLDSLRCDGLDHGGCQKGCMVFWKDSWLKAIGARSPGDDADGISKKAADYPFQYHFADGRFSCQATELTRATTYLSAYDVSSYLRDVRAKTYSVWQMIRILCYAVFLRSRSLLTGNSYRYVRGSATTTPSEALGLQPGDQVKVKSKDEITATLDRNGKNRGLAFTVEMIPFCGKTFRVLRRLERMIYEPTQQLIEVKNTVILEGVTCDGCHILRGGCPRENFHFWREAWLKRI